MPETPQSTLRNIFQRYSFLHSVQSIKQDYDENVYSVVHGDTIFLCCFIDTKSPVDYVVIYGGNAPKDKKEALDSPLDGLWSSFNAGYDLQGGKMEYERCTGMGGALVLLDMGTLDLKRVYFFSGLDQDLSVLKVVLYYGRYVVVRSHLHYVFDGKGFVSNCDATGIYNVYGDYMVTYNWFTGYGLKWGIANLRKPFRLYDMDDLAFKFQNFENLKCDYYQSEGVLVFRDDKNNISISLDSIFKPHPPEGLSSESKYVTEQIEKLSSAYPLAMGKLLQWTSSREQMIKNMEDRLTMDYAEITNRNANGLKVFLEEHPNSSDIDIIQHKTQIEQCERASREMGWFQLCQERQNDVNEVCEMLRKVILPEWETGQYNIPEDSVDKHGVAITKSRKVCNLFLDSFVPQEDLDEYIPAKARENRVKAQKLQSKEEQYGQDVYDSILQFVDKLNIIYDGDVEVCFYNKEGDDEIQDYHFAYLYDELKKRKIGIRRLDKKVFTITDTVTDVVIDLSATPKRIIENSGSIVKSKIECHRDCWKTPMNFSCYSNVVYISLMKECDEKESLQTAEDYSKKNGVRLPTNFISRLHSLQSGKEFIETPSIKLGGLKVVGKIDLDAFKKPKEIKGTIRLSKIAKNLNIGIQTIVDYLAQQGIEVNCTPNTKIPNIYYKKLEEAFGGKEKSIENQDLSPEIEETVQEVEETNGEENVSKSIDVADKLYEEKNFDEAARYYRIVADKGDAEGQFGLGRCYSEKCDYENAIYWYRKAAEQGHGRALNSLGMAYYSGEGVEQNAAKALNYLLRAEENYAPDLYCNLMEHKAIVLQKLDRHLEAYQIARVFSVDGMGCKECHAVNGYDSSLKRCPFFQKIMAECFEKGEGVKENSAKSAEYYKKAADMGMSIPQIKIAECYYKGKGVVKDREEAFRYYHLAAEQGHPFAQYSVGFLYANGQGVERNTEKAKEWLTKAVENGNESAKIELERINNTASVPQLLGRVYSWPQVTGGDAFRCFSMYYYFPTTCEWEAGEDVWDVRHLIWDFKDGKEYARAKVVAQLKRLLTYYFKESVSSLTLVCICASTAEKTEKRYKLFSNQICAETGMENGFGYVKVSQDGETMRSGGTVRPQIAVHKTFFKGKNVILFDDVVTTGGSMLKYKDWLERHDANVVAGISIGRTKHDYDQWGGVPPIDSLLSSMRQPAPNVAPPPSNSTWVWPNAQPKNEIDDDDLPF